MAHCPGVEIPLGQNINITVSARLPESTQIFIDIFRCALPLRPSFQHKELGLTNISEALVGSVPDDHPCDNPTSLLAFSTFLAPHATSQRTNSK